MRRSNLRKNDGTVPSAEGEACDGVEKMEGLTSHKVAVAIPFVSHMDLDSSTLPCKLYWSLSHWQRPLHGSSLHC